MYDVSIVGGGMVGMVSALMLAKNSDLRVAIIDARGSDRLAQSSVAEYDPRVYAITPASQRIFENIGVWSEIESSRVSPFTHMQVWDGQSQSEIHFDHAQLNVPVLGFIVEENIIRSALLQKIKSHSNIDFLCPVSLTALHVNEEWVELSCENRDAIRSKLVIGADGAQSWVREKAGIELQTHDYEQTALIAHVTTELPHQMTARQCFVSGAIVPNGPLAFLPLHDVHQCSIVWSTSPPEAEQLLNLDDEAFQKILAEAFAHRLGNVLAVSKRYIFPLYERHVKNYAKKRVALIGDAAHTLHPLAGQGMNLGLMDAACLSEIILTAARKKRDFASHHTLRSYERARKGNNFMMQSAVKMMKNLFLSDKKSIGLLRSQGMNMVDRISIIKNFFARYAMGEGRGREGKGSSLDIRH